MASEWRTVSISDLCTGIYDGPHATPKKTSDGPIFLGISNLTQGRIDLSSTEHLSEEDFATWTRRITPQAGDVVFSYETRLGEVGLIPKGLKCCLGRRMALMRPNPLKADSRFLLYAYLSPGFQDTIRARTIHGSTVDRIPLVEFPSFPIKVPPLDEQKEIAHVLGTLDDKIELNQQMNRTLEGIARALFKSWFIDFDPVRAKLDSRQPYGIDAETAALFPDSFEDSPLGKIPKGWEIKTVKDVVKGVYDGPHATPQPSDTGPAFLGIKNFTGTSLDLANIRHISEEDWPRWTKRVMPQANDIVFTYEATLGHFALIPDWLSCCLGRRIALIRRKTSENNAHFLFHTFIGDTFQEFLNSHINHGSTVDRILLTDFPSYPVLWPRKALVDCLENVLSKHWKLIQNNQKQNQALTSLRDALLPKLLSGEIRVKDAEQALEAVV